MADIKPTANQQLAIDTIYKNVVVSAGAGSGKTRVLVERFMKIILTGRDHGLTNHNAADILAITFTRKAAGEMKSRIRKSMEEKRVKEPERSIFWRQQLEALERAQISTIHSLCSRILRENPVEAQLDPGFVVADDFAGTEFTGDTLEGYVRSGLRGDKQDEESLKVNDAITQLVTAYGYSSFISQLESLQADAEDILAFGDLAEPYEEAATMVMDLRKKIALDIKKLAETRNELKGKSKTLDALVALAENEEAVVNAVIRDGDYRFYTDYVTTVRGSNKVPQIKEIKDELKELLSGVAAAEASARALPLIDCWQLVLQGYKNYSDEQKMAMDFLTYDDLESLALKLLRENEEVRHKYQDKFTFIMVDEFQDTNERQRQLIYLLCGDDEYKLEGNKLFIVGDPKQSIYRFRGADVSVFAQVSKEIEETGGEYITLADNFRSVDKVLDICNDTFEVLLQPNEINTIPYEPLNKHREGSVTPVMLCVPELKDSPYSNYEVESAALAEQVLKLHKDGVDYGKMAILLRAMTHSQDIADMFQKYNIPYEIVDGRGFYERQEILDLLNLLRALHNKHNNLQLAGVLRSPYFGLNDEVLTRLFLQSVKEGQTLWDALQHNNIEEQAELLTRAAEILRRLRGVASTMGVPELWEAIWQELHIDATLSLQEHGANRLANAKKLRQLALDFAVENQGTLASWLELVQRMIAAEVRETAANLDTEDAVTIMTIHKSKGLEFPYVFLPLLNSESQSNTDSVVFMKECGLGIKVPDDNGNLLDTSVLLDCKQLDKDLDNAERVRMLYVAMTRAEDALYLSGIVKDTKTEKALLEKNWFRQLRDIFQAEEGEELSVDIQDVDSAALTFGAEGGEQPQPMQVDAALEQAIAPLPSYLANGRQSFNASALNQYLHCQRQYFYQNLMQLPELKEEQFGDTLSAMTVGLIIHRALELYNGKNAEAAFAGAAQEFAPGQQEQLSFAYDMFQKYLDSELFETLDINHQREVAFSFHTDDGLYINGIIDYLKVNPDGSMNIVDYKTGKAPQDGESKLGYAYQLALYKKAAEQLFGRQVVAAELHYLQNLSVWKLPDAAQEDYLQGALDLCHEIAGKGEEKEFACSLENCSYCPYNYLCKKDK